MKFEIINPSDQYTMTAPDLQIAACAVALIGNGKYALQGLGEDAGLEVPLFLFGGHDEWFTEQFGTNFDDTLHHVVKNRPAELAEALDSVTLGRAERSSLNDIGRRARSVASAVRAQAEGGAA